MQITDVRVRKVTKEGKMKAVVSITLDNEFVVHDIKVIEGDTRRRCWRIIQLKNRYLVERAERSALFVSNILQTDSIT